MKSLPAEYRGSCEQAPVAATHSVVQFGLLFGPDIHRCPSHRKIGSPVELINVLMLNPWALMMMCPIGRGPSGSPAGAGMPAQIVEDPPLPRAGAGAGAAANMRSPDGPGGGNERVLVLGRLQFTSFACLVHGPATFPAV